MKVEYVQHWGDELTVVNAARVSFDKESDWEIIGVEEIYDADSRTVEVHQVKGLNTKDAKLVYYLAREGHTSCFEHMGATLRLKVPIFIARQIQRHRTFSYNEISRRYVDSEPELFWPDKWRKRAENVKQGSSDEELTDFVVEGESMGTPQEVMQAMASMTLQGYTYALETGMAPELARMILPQNMYTEFYMTGNLRSWSHFLSLRLDSHAQKEVRDVAKMVEDILLPLWPVSMEALREHG